LFAQKAHLMRSPGPRREKNARASFEATPGRR
jgi:hypothetical protein